MTPFIRGWGNMCRQNQSALKLLLNFKFYFLSKFIGVALVNKII